MFGMGMSLSQNLSHKMLCTICDKPLGAHETYCPQGKLEVLVNGTTHYRCPICFEVQLTINEDDFWQCYGEGCRKVFTQGGVFGFKLVEEEAKSKEYFVLTETDAMWLREIPVAPTPSKNARLIKSLVEERTRLRKEKGIDE